MFIILLINSIYRDLGDKLFIVLIINITHIDHGLLDIQHRYRLGSTYYLFF